MIAIYLKCDFCLLAHNFVLYRKEIRRLRVDDKLNFTISVVEKSLPDELDNCQYTKPVYLHRIYMGRSFGHLVRDTFTIMAGNLRDLSLEEETYEFLVIKQRDAWSDPHHVLEKYAGWRSSGVTLLRDLSPQGTGDTCQRHIVFSDIVIGTLLFASEPEISPQSMSIPPQRWGGCGRSVFRSHREAAYKLAGVWPVPDVLEFSQVRVVIGDKPVNDNRRIANLDHLLPVLRNRFPQYSIEALMLSNMTAQEQLLTLSTTSIFISPQVQHPHFGSLECLWFRNLNKTFCGCFDPDKMYLDNENS